MEQTQKTTLLKVARDSVAACVRGGAVSLPKSDDPQLNAPCGCFVTLKNAGRLRGCIGQFVSDSPLIGLVADMAQAAAARDPRFAADPITPDELEHLDLEISVLSPLRRTYNPLELRPGVHGLYIRRGVRSGCFLPQVATETGWDKRQFLSNCGRHKAGLEPDAWKDPATEVYLFEAEVFGAPFGKI